MSNNPAAGSEASSPQNNALGCGQELPKAGRGFTLTRNVNFGTALTIWRPIPEIQIKSRSSNGLLPLESIEGNK